MVVAGTDSGNPAARTALRPTLSDCSPTCMTQPMITSSTRAGSRSLRSTSAISGSEARSAGCQPAVFGLVGTSGGDAVVRWCGPEKLDRPVKKTSRPPGVPASMPPAIAWSPWSAGVTRQPPPFRDQFGFDAVPSRHYGRGGDRPRQGHGPLVGERGHGAHRNGGRLVRRLRRRRRGPRLGGRYVRAHPAEVLAVD